MVNKPKHSCSPVDCEPGVALSALACPASRSEPRRGKLLQLQNWLGYTRKLSNLVQDGGQKCKPRCPFWHTNHGHYKSNCPIVMSKQMSRWWRTDGGVTQRATWVNTQPLRLDCWDYLGLPNEEGRAIKSLMISLQPAVLDQFLIYSFPKMVLVLVFENHITHSPEAEPSQNVINNTCGQGSNN